MGFMEYWHLFSIIFVLTLIYFFGVRFANAIDQKINNPKPKIPIVFIRWFIYIVLSYIAFNVEFIDPSLLDAPVSYTHLTLPTNREV